MNEYDAYLQMMTQEARPQRPAEPHCFAWGIVQKVLKVLIKEFPKYMGIYLGLSGLVFFPMFILEEGQQQVIFASWNSKTAQEWILIKDTIPLLENINKTSMAINKYCGWINPIGYLSYNAYNKAEIEQIKSLRALIFANAPELFHNELMTFTFISNETEPKDGFFIFKNGKISILSSDENLPRVITGKVQVINDQIIIDLR